MSQSQNTHDDHDGIPRFEPWIGVMGASFVPAVAMLYLPPAYLEVLVVLTAALFTGGLLMKRARSARRDEP